MTDLTKKERAELDAHRGVLEAALEFFPNGEKIPYDLATDGIVLETNPNPEFKDAGKRVADLEFFGMVWDAENEYFTTPPYDESDVWASKVQCTVTWAVLVSESNADWWARMGEIQLRKQLAETPPGYKFRFYPI